MKSKKIRIFKVMLLISLIFFTSKDVQAITKDIKLPQNNSNISVTKTWKITFNQSIKRESLTNNIVVKDSKGVLANVNVSLDNSEKILMINPPTEGYNHNETYNLIINEKVKSKSGQELKNNITFNFNTEKKVILPEIDYLSMESEPVIEGEKGTFYITSSNVSSVQYRVFVYDKKLNKYEELTKGYTGLVKANKPFVISSLNSFKKGEYKLKVYVKRANEKAIYKDNNTEFDGSDVLEFSCQGNNEEGISGNINTEFSSYKVGQTITITGLENIDTKNPLYEYELKAYNLSDKGKVTNISFNGGIVNFKPEEIGEYILQISMRAINESSYKPYKAKKSKYINVNNNANTNTEDNTNNNTGNNTNENEPKTYIQYSQTLNDIVNIQLKCSPVTDANGRFISANSEEILKYIDPKNFENDDYAMFQFLKLNYLEGTTIEELNEFLKGKGVLDNKGEVFLQAAKNNNVSVEYLVAHAILETGHGKSKLASGILVDKVSGKAVEPKTTYNMFGIGAYDSDANRLGSEYAYKQNWFTVDDAIMGGAKWISDNYINSVKYKQNTLYKMRWNPTSPGVHQYATDVAWSYKQIKIIKPLIDQCKNYQFDFEIPKYKE